MIQKLKSNNSGSKNIELFEQSYNSFSDNYPPHFGDGNELKKQADDDSFFKFIRSIAFAHPLDTSHPNFLLKVKKEILFCPFIRQNIFQNDFPNISFTLYSSAISETIVFSIQFTELQEYVKRKYSQINIAREHQLDVIEKFNKKWRKRLVLRTETPLDALRDICKILKKRYHSTFEIENIISLLTCKVTFNKNLNPVLEYRDAIIALLPKLYDYVDSLCDEELYPTSLFDAIHSLPAIIHSDAGYQISKINGYLEDSICLLEDFKPFAELKGHSNGSTMYFNYKYAMDSAREFFNSLNSKYVYFDLDKVSSNDEIKLLVNTALFCERREQEKNMPNFKKI